MAGVFIKQNRVRLSGINAPESGQAFGQRAKQYLSGLVRRKHVMAEAHKRDRYGRAVATVCVDGTDVGQLEGHPKVAGSLGESPPRISCGSLSDKPPTPAGASRG